MLTRQRLHIVSLFSLAIVLAILNPLAGPTAFAQDEACCFTDGTCLDIDPGDCAADGGTPRGPGTTCADVICPASDHCSAPALAIPDDNPAGITDTINVADSDTIFKVEVYVRVTHTWVGDVAIALEHVDTGTMVTIYDRPGVPDSAFGCSANNFEIILDDEALLPIEGQCEPGPPAQFGSFMPNDPLSAFAGESTAGMWTLTISDHEGADTGTLEEWCLLFLFDTDGDGVDDTMDACPDDPNKSLYGGICGCGVSDDDSDGDGVPDCFDGCPDDPNKLHAGICGCGNPDVDSDLDGWLDCFDNCPNDQNPLQEDENNDGVGDACTPPPAGGACPDGGMGMMTMAMTAAMLGVGLLRRRRGLRYRGRRHARRRPPSISRVIWAALLLASVATSARAQPVNDLCDDAIPVVVPSGTMGTTTGATVDMEFAGPPACGTSITAGGVWYSAMGTGNTMTATTCDGNVTTNYDTKLSVFCSCEFMICVGGNDDGSPSAINPDADCVIAQTGSAFNRASTVNWCSEPGAIYLILVHGFAAEMGDFELIITDDGMACGAPTANCDADGDGVVNPLDACPGSDDNADADADGTPDGCDACPDDPDKFQNPGICGCGSDDDDSDGDGLPDCFDGCPNDPNKVQAGLCGCGNPDVDTDGDGWLDCFDNCPGDPNPLQEDDDLNGVGNACDTAAGSPCPGSGMMAMSMTMLGVGCMCRRRRRKAL